MKKLRATFTLDEETGTVLRRTAAKHTNSKSDVAPAVVQEYAGRAGRLSEAARLRLLASFDEHIPRIPKHPLAEIEAEIEETRRSHRADGRCQATMR